MIKFCNKSWDVSITRNLPLFHNSIDVAGHYFNSKKYSVFQMEQLAILENGCRAFIFKNKENLDKYNKSIEMVCMDPEKFKKLEETYYKFGKALLKASYELEQNLSLPFFNRFIRSYGNLSAGLYLTAALGRHMAELLIDRLKKYFPNISKPEMDYIISDITYPEKHTPLAESQVSLLEIGAELQSLRLEVKDIKSNSKLYKKFEEIVEKYSVIPVNFNEEPWTEEQMLNQLNDLMKKNCKEEKDKIEEQHKDRIKQSHQLLSEIKDEEIRLIANSLKVGTYLNEYRKFIFCRASLAYRPLFKKIANLYDIDWKECWKLTSDEVIDLYFKGKKEILNVLSERDWTGIIFAENDKGYRLLTKQELKPFIEEIKKIVPKEEKISEVNEINGTIGNKGFVKGVVKVILGSSDFHKFKEGDIIVTTMTSVDFVPLMKRASAFVTNEGGITCHAAIVSRELGKPCIIGAKIATKVFNDGDRVEVDADKGVVRKVK